MKHPLTKQSRSPHPICGPDPQSARAERFRTTRQQHSKEAAEDYTELIAELIEKHGEARTGTIAEHLGVSHVTALRTLRRLQHEGFVSTARHKPILLTAKGKRVAETARARHQLVVQFFTLLGLSPEVAETDAEGVEHHLSKETLQRMAEVVRCGRIP